jgi:hypothetical protein
MKSTGSMSPNALGIEQRMLLQSIERMGGCATSHELAMYWQPTWPVEAVDAQLKALRQIGVVSCSAGHRGQRYSLVKE